MIDWSSLLQAALVGAERPWSLPAGVTTDPVQGLLREAAALAPPDAPGQLLRLAGALALCRQAGWQAPPGTIAAPAPAPAESRREADADWVDLLSGGLAHGPLRLQAQLLRAMVNAGLHAPPALLSALLQLGRANVLLRADLGPVLGERGRWLAAQNPDWAYACGAEESASAATHWERGNLEQRRAVLHAERASAPGQARARLEADWSSLAAKDRALLLQTLATGLSIDDEAFLAAQLKDRAQDVRSGAADLLASLPDSAYAQRMAARLAPLCVSGNESPGLLKRITGLAVPRVRFEAPLQKEADWKADGIETELPKYESLGERAWWLYQLTRRSSLAWWCVHSGLDAAALVRLAVASDWAEALLRGWLHALLTQPDADWAEALLSLGGARRETMPAPLLAMLPVERREAWQLAQLSSDNALHAAIDACLSGVAAQDCWGAALSLRFVQLLQPKLAQGALQQDYGLRQQLPDLLCALHPDALAGWSSPPRGDDDTASLSDCLNLLEQVLSSRRRMQTLISQP
ncbi:DUF5691 domain-containing protein [Polaromonas sp.]|uniref:DUF5691 domain-containing protein n=1 Tax=Polaromonas sp. TaxID=1869339 RepID=UPI003263C38B